MPGKCRQENEDSETASGVENEKIFIYVTCFYCTPSPIQNRKLKHIAKQAAIINHCQICLAALHDMHRSVTLLFCSTNQGNRSKLRQHSYSIAVLSNSCFHGNMLLSPPCSSCQIGCDVRTMSLEEEQLLMCFNVWLWMFLCACLDGHFSGGHDNFRKMIDEAEPLGYPVVVKNARGHRGKVIRPLLSCRSPRSPQCTLKCPHERGFSPP